MFDNEIITQGERLKKYRNMLGATQSEVAQFSQFVCTKNMISQIENNKQKLNFNLAAGIAENLNRIAKKKKINISLITPDELMKDEDKQANYIFDKIINELKEIKEIDVFEQKLRDAEEIIEKYSITDNIIELYKLSADFYYYKHSYVNSEQMCDIGLKISIDSQNTFEEVNMYIYKSRNDIFTDNYIRALRKLDHAEKLNNCIMDNDLFIMIFYYRGLAYKKLGEYDSALEFFEILKKFEIKDQKMLIKIKMVHANCLNDNHEFDKAEKEYKEALNIAMDNNEKDLTAQTYRNLSELYFNKKDYKSAAMYIKDCLKNHSENEDLGETLYFTAKVLRYVNEDIEAYLLQALEICEAKDRENLDLIEQIIYELVLIYIKREDEKNIMLMTRKVEKLNIDFRSIYGELVEYYRERKKEKSIYFNRKSIEKSNQAKKK